MFFDYPKEMKEDFINYWTEGKNKMRYQKQVTFEIKLRLERWSKNSAKWDKPKFNSTSKLDATDRVHGKKLKSYYEYSRRIKTEDLFRKVIQKKCYRFR